MKEFWNERYSKQEFIYGKEPNVFFAEQLSLLKTGKIILPCEGEGRNAVFAATNGWGVQAFDSSEAAKIKAQNLASEKKTSIFYQVSDALDITYEKSSVDVVAFIYAHFPIYSRKIIHQKAIDWLKPNGKIILEAFTPKQLENNSGGPKELSMLYTIEMMQNDFKGLDIEILVSEQTELNEGNYHKGKADIIRLVAQKI